MEEAKKLLPGDYPVGCAYHIKLADRIDHAFGMGKQACVDAIRRALDEGAPYRTAVIFPVQDAVAAVEPPWVCHECKSMAPHGYPHSHIHGCTQGPAYIHILHQGVSLCRMPGVPAKWPEGHKWVSVEHATEATCPSCKVVLEYKGEGG